MPLGRSRRRLGYQRSLHFILALLGLPFFALTALVLSQTHAGALVWFAACACALAIWALLQASLADRLLRPLQTLSNVVAALRENDYSFRARGARRGDALGDLALEVNALANDLQRERVASLESTALMQQVLSVMDAPVFAFDDRGLLRLLNPAGAALLPTAKNNPLGRHAEALGLGSLLATTDGQLIRFGDKQWMARRSGFREGGVPHRLLLLTDVGEVLRDEERQAWQRLIRVMGHEVNNSLTPIKSLAGSLRQLARQGTPGPEFDRPLEIIEDRAASLNRFLAAYRQLAQLPTPRRRPLALGPFLRQLAGLETRVAVVVTANEPVSISADKDQLGQAVLNLLRNAAEAALENTGVPARVEIGWRGEGSQAAILLRDSGLGVANHANLFVPFYTTKPGGTGIGLLLARQIAEAHGGTVMLRNREEGGAEAELRLPFGDGCATSV